MSTRSEVVSPALLREWGLPEPGSSKKSRGRVIVVGGSRRSPGAVLLAGEAALRVGAGRLGLVVPGSVDAQLSVTMPEAAIFALPDDADEPLTGSVRDEVAGADAVLVGPGFDDADATRATLLTVAEAGPPCLVLDAYGLGVLPSVDRSALPRSLILNPNEEEAARLLDRELGDDRLADLREIAERFDAVVNCYGTIVDPSGGLWSVAGGGPGLGTSGSGDVLAGAIAGFAARGVPPQRAAVWGSWAHAWAGDRLTERAGLGFLARQLPEQLAFAVLEALG
jgi:ADP-dependent NAD(P)H-hydrate dehydratase